MILSSCPRCGVRPGNKHKRSCSAEQCSNCGHQYFCCGCPPCLRTPRLTWTGDLPGVAECRRFGFLVKLVPGKGYVPCDKDDPDAEPDMNRLFREARWDPAARRFIR